MSEITRRPSLLRLLGTTSHNSNHHHNYYSNHRRVCVLQNNDCENYNENDSDNRYLQDIISKQVADSLSLPLMTASQLMTARMEDEEEDLEDKDDDNNNGLLFFTHALCIMDYPDGKDVLEETDRYVVAIQPIPPPTPTSTSRTTGFQESKPKRPRRKPKKKSLTKLLFSKTSKPYWIDFCPPTPSPRSNSNSAGGHPDFLVQAVAPQRVSSSSRRGEGGEGAVIYDLTAGWGQDSLLLALAEGTSHVHMVERDPIVACLLQDALRRVQCIAATASSSSSWQDRAFQLQQRLSLLQVQDARDVLKDLTTTTTTNEYTTTTSTTTTTNEQPDIIYLDPMFPPRTKSAAVKKGMQILHGLVRVSSSSSATSADTTSSSHEAEVLPSREAEEAELLQLAYQVARVKVVVKRPIHAPTLGGTESDLKPSNTVKGSINRWDIYVI